MSYEYTLCQMATMQLQYILYTACIYTTSCMHVHAHTSMTLYVHISAI